MGRIAKVLCCYATHLTMQTVRQLDQRPLDDWFCAGGPYGYDGWFVYAHDENSGVGDDAIPDDLWAIMEYARSEGCDYVLIGREDEQDDIPLPVYPRLAEAQIGIPSGGLIDMQPAMAMLDDGSTDTMKRALAGALAVASVNGAYLGDEVCAWAVRVLKDDPEPPMAHVQKAIALLKAEG